MSQNKVETFWFVSYLYSKSLGQLGWGNISFTVDQVIFSQQDVMQHLKEVYRVPNATIINFQKLTKEEFEIINSEVGEFPDIKD